MGMIDFSLPDLPLAFSETVDRYLNGQMNTNGSMTIAPKLFKA